MNHVERRAKRMAIARVMVVEGLSAAEAAVRFGVSKSLASSARQQFGERYKPIEPEPEAEPRDPRFIPDAATLRECRLAREEAAAHPDYKYKPSFE